MRVLLFAGLTLGAAFPASVHAQRAFVLGTGAQFANLLVEETPPPVVDRDFMQNQLRHPRVMDAWVAKRYELIDLFEDRGVTFPAAEVYLRVFKRERVIELWGRSPSHARFTLIKEYPICALSDIGPKRQQGDGLTPEGFYHVDFLNPESQFHLSLHVNYPNAADRQLGVSEALGGDIFIHGGCLTEGCIAVTDESIKELYWVAVEAAGVGQRRIPVHIFPARMDDANLQQLARVFHADSALVDFWQQLRGGYDYFEQNRMLPEMRISTRGRYLMPGEVDPLEELLGPRLLGDPYAPAPDVAGRSLETPVRARITPAASAGPQLLGAPVTPAPSPPAPPAGRGGGGQ